MEVKRGVRRRHLGTVGAIAPDAEGPRIPAPTASSFSA